MQFSSLMPVAPYQALIFDCDGTIAHTTSIHYQSWAETLTFFGGTLPESWYYERTGISSLELIEMINQAFGYSLDPQQVKRKKYERFAKLLSEVKPVQEVVEIVEYHRGKVPLAIASGGSRQNVDATLKAISLETSFNLVVTIEDVTKGKPDPEIFLTVAERLNVPPEQCVVYEDTDVGILAATRAGMRSIDIRTVVQQGDR